MRSSFLSREMKLTFPVAFIDHIAVTVVNLDAACQFYRDVLKAEIVHEFMIEGRLIARQMRIGGAMLNLHQQGHGQSLVARRPTPGAVDLCFRWTENISSAVDHLATTGIEIIEGPCVRFASDGQEGRSVYFRDPDGNLLEFLSTNLST